MTAPAAAPTTEFSVFLPFSKVLTQPDGTLMVHTILNDETMDDQGEIVDFSAVEKASAAYMEWANVREQHNEHTAAGTMVALTPDPERRTHEAILHVVDAEAVKKVSSGVYKGSSLGGWKRRIRLQKGATGEMVKHLTEFDWVETSLVDRPSRPTARLTLLKRSDGGDPPPLVEEDPMDDETTLAAPEAPTDAPLAKVSDPATASEAGVDVYLGADGKPLTKVALAPEAIDLPIDEPLAKMIKHEGDDWVLYTKDGSKVLGHHKTKKDAEAQEAAIEANKSAKIGDLAKSAADDVVTIHIVAESLDRLIEAEADEPDQLAILRQMRALASQFEAAESAEVGTPEDLAEAATEDVDVITTVIVSASDAPMYYGAKIGDLAKVATDPKVGLEAWRTAIQGIVGEALAKVAAPVAPVVAEPTTPEEPPTLDELLTKTTTLLDERFARYVSRPDLDAMKAEILEAFGPIKEDLAKIAKFPAAGGPLRFAVDGARFAADETGPSTEADVLAKASRATSDPHLREELGRLAAVAQIEADRRR